MTTTATILAPGSGPQVPVTPRPGITKPRTADILDEDGRYLTTAELPVPSLGSVLPLGDVDEPSILLQYVFGRGQRMVLLDLNGEQVTGWLGTGWEHGQRIWWLEVVRFVPSKPAAWSRAVCGAGGWG